MHRLCVLRHAKSSWDDPSRADHERPLNKRGRRAAPLIGSYIRDRGHVPDLVLCSSSVRTRETFGLLGLTAVEQLEHVDFSDALYLATAPELLEIVRGLDDAVSSVMVIGHNPGMHTLVDVLGLHVDKFPTAALAVFETGEPWDQLGSASVRIVDHVMPRALAD